MAEPKKLIGGYRILKDGPFKTGGSVAGNNKEPVTAKVLSKAPILPKTTSSLSLPKNKK
ncbi:MAG: hypothetical protein KDA50_09585 [Rhodobacteraceae bacterium]|nr:hypothetical protein [Paracoccaceae bacterium]